MASLPTTVAEVEPNETPETAQVIVPVHAVVTGTVATLSDTDYYGVSVAPGKTLSVTLNMGNSAQNYQLYLYDAAGAVLAASTNPTGLPETVKVTNTTTSAQSYRVRVAYGAGGTGGIEGKYMLNLLQQ